MSTRTTANTDNGGLEPLNAEGILIGFVNDVNGDGAIEVPEFVPTLAELLELVRHWELIFLQRSYFVFCTDQVGSTDLRLAPFAERRVMRIIGLLGQDAIHAVREEEDAFAKGIGLPKWKELPRSEPSPRRKPGRAPETNNCGCLKSWNGAPNR